MSRVIGRTFGAIPVLNDDDGQRSGRSVEGKERICRIDEFVSAGVLWRNIIWWLINISRPAEATLEEAMLVNSRRASQFNN